MSKIMAFVGAFLLGLAVTLIVGMILAPFICLLWDAIMPALIGAATLSYWKAVGLLFLVGLLTPDIKINN